MSWWKTSTAMRMTTPRKIGILPKKYRNFIGVQSEKNVRKWYCGKVSKCHYVKIHLLLRRWTVTKPPSVGRAHNQHWPKQVVKLLRSWRSRYSAHHLVPGNVLWWGHRWDASVPFYAWSWFDSGSYLSPRKFDSFSSYQQFNDIWSKCNLRLNQYQFSNSNFFLGARCYGTKKLSACFIGLAAATIKRDWFIQKECYQAAGPGVIINLAVKRLSFPVGKQAVTYISACSGR